LRRFGRKCGSTIKPTKSSPLTLELKHLFGVSNSFLSFFPFLSLFLHLFKDVMDEVGSSIQESDEPSFLCMPILYAPTGLAYSLLWPIQDIKAGEFATRDYYPSSNPTTLPFSDFSHFLRLESPNELIRQAHLTAWFETPTSEPFDVALQMKLEKLALIRPPPCPPPVHTQSLSKDTKRKWKVHTDIHLVKDHLKVFPSIPFSSSSSLIFGL